MGRPQSLLWKSSTTILQNGYFPLALFVFAMWLFSPYPKNNGLLITGITLAIFMASHATRSRWSKTSSSNGCLPAPRYPHLDPFGFMTLLSSLYALYKGNLMAEIKRRFDEDLNGGQGARTFRTVVLDESIIYTISPRNVQTIFATNSNHYGIAPTRKLALGIFGPGIFVKDGPAWVASRAALRPNLMRTHFADVELLERHFQGLLINIPVGTAVQMEGLFGALTMDIITELILGESTQLLRGEPTEKARKFTEVFDYVSNKLSIRMGLGWIATIWPDPKFDRGVIDLKAFIDEYVDRAMKWREPNSQTSRKENQIEEEDEIFTNKTNFLSGLAKSDYDKNNIAAELINVITAGRGSIASLMTVFWFWVIRNHQVVQTLRQEITSMFGREPPTFEQLKSLKYLNWTIKEVLRLYPVVPINSRIAVTDTILPEGGGEDGDSPIFIKKGTRILHFPYAMYRDRNIYGLDADEFRPERWETLRPGWEYIPFSGGPRTCVGQQVALTEIMYMTVRLLQAFENIVIGDDAPWEEKMVLSMSSRYGCCLKFGHQEDEEDVKI